MFWLYLLAVLLVYGFTRNVYLSVFLGTLASIVLVILGSIFGQPSSASLQGEL